MNTINFKIKNYFFQIIILKRYKIFQIIKNNNDKLSNKYFYIFIILFLKYKNIVAIKNIIEI